MRGIDGRYTKGTWEPKEWLFFRGSSKTKPRSDASHQDSEAVFFEDQMAEECHPRWNCSACLALQGVLAQQSERPLANPRPLAADEQIFFEVLKSRISSRRALSSFYPDAEFESADLRETCVHLLQPFFSS